MSHQSPFQKKKLKTSLLSEKETEIQKLDDSKTVNENKIADMKHEIENLKKREASSTKPNQSQERRNMRNPRLLSNMRGRKQQ